jgi:hypothetical protein
VPAGLYPFFDKVRDCLFQECKRRGIRMPDCHRKSALPRQRLEALELLCNLFRRRISIQEHVPLDRRHALFRCNLQRNAAMRGVTVDEVEPAGAQNLFHEPAHVAGVTRKQAAAMAVHAHRKRHGIYCGREGIGERFAGRIEGNRARFCRIVMINRLQREMQQHFLAALPGRLRQVRRSRRAGKDRAHHGAGQRDGAVPRSQVVAEIINDDCDARRRLCEALRREQQQDRGGAQLCKRH